MLPPLLEKVLGKVLLVVGKMSLLVLENLLPGEGVVYVVGAWDMNFH